jgi:hypothetical protein
LEQRREALIQRSLGRRANIELCLHGINKYYCTHCTAKKAAKPAKNAAAKAEKEKPTATAE